MITNDPAAIVGKECKFAIHIPGRQGMPDVHMVKERIHRADGTTYPNISFVKDFKRPFWVTNPNSQTHKQKKEIEHLSKLMRYTCTQTELRDRVAHALGIGYSNDPIRKLANSPYLYGSEISSTAIIKYLYQKKNAGFISPFSVMTFDIETDMVNGTEEPIIITAVYEKEVFIACTKQFIQGIVNVKTHLQSKAEEYITEFTDIKQYNIIFLEANDTIDLIKIAFEWVHSKKPDLLAIWNMDFDIPKILATLDKHGEDPIDILCDPSVPRAARICKYRQGLKKKKKANGQEFPIDVADQWHSLTLTASFYVIDAMCTYRLMRLAKQKDPSYSLDSILEKELGARKLKFKQADAYKKAAWHTFMQSNYKLEYMVYAMFDSLSMQLLDNKTMDLRFNFPSYANITDFAKGNSKPKMIADALHYFAIEQGFVLNSVGEQNDYVAQPVLDGEEASEVENTDVMDLTGWIVTLPAHLVVPGLALIAECGLERTKLRGFVYDSDCVSAYPTCTSILNVSKSTTKREIIDIRGVEEFLFRLQNINLCSGYVNALEYGTEMFGLPNMFELDDLLTEDVIKAELEIA